MSEIILPVKQVVARDADSNPFASVSVNCVNGGCTAAREMAGKRHLLDEAPALPLAQCSADVCDCRYFKYGDRRSLLTNRRRNGSTSGRAHNWLWQNNRRSGQERRKLKIDFRRWTTARDTVIAAGISS